MNVEERRQWHERRRYLTDVATILGTDVRFLNQATGITLWEDGPNHAKIVKYVNNSQCHANVKLTVLNIHRIWRRGDPQSLGNLFPNRKLLWHGTKRANIPNILADGFTLPPSTGQMFGSGIYFADRITKSSNYSDADKTFLLLCEVGLGKIYSCKESHPTWTSSPSGFDSVKGNGSHVPDWTENGHFMGCHIPFGKTAKCTKYSSHSLLYNEFIVYEPNRIIIRFLVEVEVERVHCPMTLVVPRVTSNQGVRRNQQNSSVSQPQHGHPFMGQPLTQLPSGTVTRRALATAAGPIPAHRTQAASSAGLRPQLPTGTRTVTVARRPIATVVGPVVPAPLPQAAVLSLPGSSSQQMLRDNLSRLQLQTPAPPLPAPRSTPSTPVYQRNNAANAVAQPDTGRGTNYSTFTTPGTSSIRRGVPHDQNGNDFGCVPCCIIL